MKNNDLIVLSPAWPSLTYGYGIAVRASLLLYTKYFTKVHFICVRDQKFDDAKAWATFNVEWNHISIRKNAMWIRFIKSLSSSNPAITVRYAVARRKLVKNIDDAVKKSKNCPYLIFEDIPMACFLKTIKHRYPDMTLALRSHNMLDKAYGPFAFTGPLIHRLAWMLERIKVRRFEKYVCEHVEKFWAISREDADEYSNRLSVVADGVVGVCLDVERFEEVTTGEIKTVINIGTADLRKGGGLIDFIKGPWQLVRKEIPEARLLLAGRGTDRFTEKCLGVEGLGYVSDDRDVLDKGLLFINPQKIAAGVQLKSIVAMLSGKVLISTKPSIEGIAGRNGQHFIAVELNKMASHIISLMRNPDRAKNIADRARKLAFKTYSTRRFIDNTKPLMENLLKKA